MAKGKKISKKQRRKRKLILFIVEIIILIIVAGALYVYSKLKPFFNRKELDQSKVGKKMRFQKKHSRRLKEIRPSRCLVWITVIRAYMIPVTVMLLWL